MVRIDPPGGVPPLVVRTSRSSLSASDGGRYTIGRDPDCDVYLDDPRVSREHAALRVVDGTWVLEDLSSRNGTWLDGERVHRLEITSSLTIRLASADDGPVIHLEVPTPPSGTDAPRGRLDRRDTHHHGAGARTTSLALRHWPAASAVSAGSRIRARP